MSVFSFGSTGIGLPYIPGNDSFTTLLLHGNGNFTDSSQSNFSPSDLVDTTTTTSSPKFGTGCISFNSSSSSLRYAQSSSLQDQSTSFTVDFWIKTSSMSNATYIMAYEDQTDNFWHWRMTGGTSGIIGVSLEYFGGLTGTVSGPSGSILDGNWHHIAFLRDGNNFQIFRDGIGGAITSNASSIGPANDFNPPGVNVFSISQPSGGGGTHFQGQMDEIRYSHGKARWPAGTNFTPPVLPYGP